MTVMNKTNELKFIAACRDIVNKVNWQTRFTYDTQKLASLFMTDKEIADVHGFFKNYLAEVNCIAPVVSLVTKFNHPIIGEVQVDVDFDFDRVGGAPDWVWPRGPMRIRHGADEQLLREVTEGMADYVQAKCDLHIFRVVVDYIKNLRHIEEMRYLFPTVIRIFRQAGLEQIANRFAEVRKPPANMTPLDKKMRTYIKYTNHWCAMQELMGTFDKPYESVSMNHTNITLSRNIEAEGFDADGNRTRIRVCP